MFCCIFGYQRNKIFGIPTFEMLLFIDGKGNESQIAQDCRKVGMDHYLSTTTICQLLCLVPHRYKCICTFFIREMIVLNDGGLIGMSEPNLWRYFWGKKSVSDFWNWRVWGTNVIRNLDRNTEGSCWIGLGSICVCVNTCLQIKEAIENNVPETVLDEEKLYFRPRGIRPFSREPTFLHYGYWRAIQTEEWKRRSFQYFSMVLMSDFL